MWAFYKGRWCYECGSENHIILFYILTKPCGCMITGAELCYTEKQTLNDLSWIVTLFPVKSIFVSPAEVILRDHFSVVCLSVRPSVRLSVRPSVRLSVRTSHFLSRHTFSVQMQKLKVNLCYWNETSYVERAEASQEPCTRSITLASIFWSFSPLSIVPSHFFCPNAITQVQLILLKWNLICG